MKLLSSSSVDFIWRGDLTPVDHVSRLSVSGVDLTMTCCQIGCCCLRQNTTTVNTFFCYLFFCSLWRGFNAGKWQMPSRQAVESLNVWGWTLAALVWADHLSSMKSYIIVVYIQFFALLFLLSSFCFALNKKSRPSRRGLSSWNWFL